MGTSRIPPLPGKTSNAPWVSFFLCNKGRVTIFGSEDCYHTYQISSKRPGIPFPLAPRASPRGEPSAPLLSTYLTLTLLLIFDLPVSHKSDSFPSAAT